MLGVLAEPWPWYIAGPLIGLMVPALLLFRRKLFGISSSYRQICAATVPGGIEYFRYDWKEQSWKLAFVLGLTLGGLVGGVLLTEPGHVVDIAAATRADLTALGVTDLSGLVPDDIFSWSNLLTVSGAFTILGGGFLLGFGARYAGGCTSGHGVTGLATLQKASLVAVIGFFVGGLIATHLLLPILL